MRCLYNFEVNIFKNILVQIEIHCVHMQHESKYPWSPSLETLKIGWFCKCFSFLENWFGRALQVYFIISLLNNYKYNMLHEKYYNSLPSISGHYTFFSLWNNSRSTSKEIPRSLWNSSVPFVVYMNSSFDNWTVWWSELFYLKSNPFFELMVILH